MLNLFLLEDDGPHVIHPYTILTAAENEQEARKLALENADWLDNDTLNCKHVGTASKGTERGIILAGYLDS